MKATDAKCKCINEVLYTLDEKMEMYRRVLLSDEARRFLKLVKEERLRRLCNQRALVWAKWHVLNNIWLNTYEMLEKL